MSLQVWLPLTKDLRNQGLASSANFGNTTAFATTGKLGAKSLYSNAQKTVTFTELNNITNFSFAYWIKVDSSITISSWADIIGLECIVGNTTTIIRDEFTSTAGCHQILMGKDSTVGSNTNTYYGTGASATGAKDMWTHYAVIKNNINTYVYTNGVLTNTLTNTNFENSPQKLTGKIYLGNTSSTAAQINDFRLYDHCLSPMEIKELAKGLVLHYPLNRQGWGQENLITDSTSEWSAWITPAINTQNSTNYPNHATLPETGKSAGDVYTCQVEIEFSGVTAGSGGTCFMSAQGSVNGGWSNGTNPWGYRLWTSTIPADGIYKYTWTGTLDATSATKTAFNCGYRCDYWGSGKYRVRLAKFEKGSVATPWIPHNSQAIYSTLGLNGTTEYDCSGFCNNGTRTGTFTWISDAPKYAVSTKLTTGSKITSSTGMITTANPTFTCNFWVKMPSATYTTWADIITFPGSATIRMETSNTAGTNLSWYNYPIGTSSGIGTNGTVNNTDWNMFTLTCDGTNWKTYKNGVLASTVAISGTAWTPNGTVSIGDNGMYAQLSDVRIYATALSADDVKSLYQNCATIDPDGTIRGQIRS